MKQSLIALAAALYLVFAPVKADADDTPVKASMELMAGQDSAILDIKLLGSLGSGFAVFNRNRITALYGGAENLGEVGASSFHVVNFRYALPWVKRPHSLEALAEVDVIAGKGIDPRFGVQYGVTLGDVSLSQIVSLGSAPDGLLITNVGYAPEVAQDVRVVGRLENVTSVSGDGHTSSTQRVRLGVALGQYELGVAGDLIEKGNEGNFGYNAGGFVSVKF